MKYVSTRGAAPALDFRGALLAGLAPDGGLYVPEHFPEFSPRDIAAMADLSYQALAERILTPFVGDAYAPGELRGMIDTAYAGFRHPAIAPLTQLGTGHFLLELFHGPTLAFKDFALQLLGPLMEHALRDVNRKSVVLGATSGDTGSAAIAGLSGRKHIDIVILYPEGRTSDVQRRQMTSVADANVHALAVQGTFDDCQALVKTLFSDAALRREVNLLAVNSINWARVLAQVVYYFYAALSLGAPATRVNFAVPTGNFGDIYAGYIARRLGLPIGKLIIATNKNDILARCVATGEYAMQGVSATLSPSMDIEIASNFERLLFELYGRNAARLTQAMEDFRATRSLRLSPAMHADFLRDFAAHTVSDDRTLSTIRGTYEATGLVLDPHSAVGVTAAYALENELSGPTVSLATAHASKFPEAVERAINQRPVLPAHMADLYEREERIRVIANDAAALKDIITRL